MFYRRIVPLVIGCRLHHCQFVRSSCLRRISFAWDSGYQHQRAGSSGFGSKQGTSSSSSSSDTLKRIALLSGIVSYLKSTLGIYDKIDEDDDIRMDIKKAIVAMQYQRYDEAEEYLHVALGRARERDHTDAVNYIYDVLANLAYQRQDLDTAESIFIELMKQLFSQGGSQSDPPMIEISIKLADIYAQKGDIEKAEAGFLFAIKEQAKKANEAERKARKITMNRAPQQSWFFPGDKDATALYGMAVEAYARFLLSVDRFDDGEHFFREALEVSSELYGPTHRQTITLMNNYGTILLRKHRFDLAEKYFDNIVARAIEIEEMADMLPGFYTNLAEAQWHNGKQAEALENARRARKLAGELGDKDAISHTEQYLTQIESEYSTFKQQRDKQEKKGWFS